MKQKCLWKLYRIPASRSMFRTTSVVLADLAQGALPQVQSVPTTETRGGCLHWWARPLSVSVSLSQAGVQSPLCPDGSFLCCPSRQTSDGSGSCHSRHRGAAGRWLPPGPALALCPFGERSVCL